MTTLAEYVMSQKQKQESQNPRAEVVSPARFVELATKAGWREAVIDILSQRPFGREPFIIDGKWIVIRPA